MHVGKGIEYSYQHLTNVMSLGLCVFIHLDIQSREKYTFNAPTQNSSVLNITELHVLTSTVVSKGASMDFKELHWCDTYVLPRQRRAVMLITNTFI